MNVPDLSLVYPKVFEAWNSLGWDMSDREKRREFQRWMQNMKVPYLNERTPLEAIREGDEEKVIEGLDALASGAFI